MSSFIPLIHELNIVVNKESILNFWFLCLFFSFFFFEGNLNSIKSGKKKRDYNRSFKFQHLNSIAVDSSASLLFYIFCLLLFEVSRYFFFFFDKRTRHILNFHFPFLLYFFSKWVEMKSTFVVKKYAQWKGSRKIRSRRLL